MGRKDKKYSKSLKEQAYDKLTSMQAFGESKKLAKENGTDRDKIFSYNTYITYKKHVYYFLAYIQQSYPEVTTLKKARQYVPEWLQLRVDQGLSAWTIHTEAKALSKLYGIMPDDTDFFKPPKRKRESIKRSRTSVKRDKHFSVTNNDELIRFCKGIGARREGMNKIKGKDLMHITQINDEAKALEKKPNRTQKEENMLAALHDAQLFMNECNYFVYLKEKGGRIRISPIIGPDKEMIIARFKSTGHDEKVWQHIHSAADIHSYRAEYATAIYRMYARKIEEIPYDKCHPGIKHMIQSEVYTCRGDESKKKLDRNAMFLASKALGHNRIDIVADNYIRNL